MNKIRHVLKKEFLIIGRDIPSLILLFVMPAAFIIVMSMAMGELFAGHAKVQIHILAANYDTGVKAKLFMENLEKAGTFIMHPVDRKMDIEGIRSRMLAENYKFALIIRNDFTAVMESKNLNENRKPVLMMVNPSVSTQTQAIFKEAVSADIGKLRFSAFVDNLGKLLDFAKIDPKALKRNIMVQDDPSLEVRYVYKDKQEGIIPSAVQQSVPAWLVFAMFFISMPIANTFITEKNQGTLVRMISMNVSKGYLLFGKFLPYFLINMTQVFFMILVGMYVVPFLGGQALTPGDSPGGLFVIAASVSFSAVSLALLISSLAKTTEQATTVSGIMHVIFAAIGGIMVPTFVMPQFMQKLAVISPMSWGLEGFLDIFLRHGGVGDVMTKAAALLAFGVVMLAATVIVLKNQFERGRSV
jgi:ABC-2 type transport system permease protein